MPRKPRSKIVGSRDNFERRKRDDALRELKEEIHRRQAERRRQDEEDYFDEQSEYDEQ